MSTVLIIVLTLLFFGVIITIHEFGHFIAARANKITVSEFSIGMGPAIYKKQGENTLFTLRLLPIGGYCAMNEDTENDDPNSYRKKSVWARMAVILAGPLMNLILGFILSIAMLIVVGYGVSSVVVDFSENSKSQFYGLEMYDEIVEINGVSIFTSQDITYQLSSDKDGIVDFVVKRDGEKIEINDIAFEMIYDEQLDSSTLKYDFKVAREGVTFTNIFEYAFKNTAYYSRIVLFSVRDLLTGTYKINDLQGPVGVVTAIDEVTKDYGFDIEFIMSMAILLTINIGIFNLLPVPALDGGRFFFLVIEAIRRKPIKASVEATINFIGFALLLLLMIYVTSKDIFNIFI